MTDIRNYDYNRGREDMAEELAVKFELLDSGKYPVTTITIQEAASFAREFVCPTCHELDSDWCTRSWHRARTLIQSYT